MKAVAHCPDESALRRWASSHWVEYQSWLFHHSFVSLSHWQKLNATALSWADPPFISLVTPIYNTVPAQLHACINSVLSQTYPFWELCLVNDGSSHEDTLHYLQTLPQRDPRLHLQHLPANRGICHASNQALSMAQGEYIAFLDHDDRLAPDALHHVAHLLRSEPDTDIVYTDRDMLSPEGYRLMHLLKPDWSPETLLSGNYLFHLLVYRRRLLQNIGGLRIGLEGSQDYDLILRATDGAARVRHIPRVLYHWRQHAESVALVHNAKEYAYAAGIQALQETLKRRGIHADVQENTLLWRGNYYLSFAEQPRQRCRVLQLGDLYQDYATNVNQAFQQDQGNDAVLVLGPGVKMTEEQALNAMLGWFQIEGVGLVTGKVVNTQQQLLHAGLVQRINGIPLSVYNGQSENTPGYMAVTAITRNVSTPHPACCLIRRSLWQSLNGLDNSFQGPYALLDFALRALQSGFRCVYTPFARFLANDDWTDAADWPEAPRQQFIDHWHDWLAKGDPYYHPLLTLELNDMGLNMRIPAPEPNH